jgi:hypothetical protein
MDINHNLDQQVMERYLDTFCGHLEVASNAREIELNRAWANKFPKHPGVYAVFENQLVVYVGESGSLRGRMTDMLDSRHHVLRRNLGAALYEKEPEFEQASTKTKFPSQLEARLNEYIQSNLKICVVTVALGRKEIEERLIEKHDPVHNRKGRRTT